MKENLNIPTTEIGKSYWDNNGLYQEDYDRLYDSLVPAEGMAETLFGEVVRAASRLSYEYYNNGNWNARKESLEGEYVECEYCNGTGRCYDDDDNEYECPDCNGTGEYYEEIEGECEIDPFYKNFIELLRMFFNDNMPEASRLMDDIEDVIINGRCSIEKERPYILMIDAVVYIIKNKAIDLEAAMKCSPEIPEWYKN